MAAAYAIRSAPPVSRRCSRTNSGAHSVQPVAMSVSTKVCTKLPLATGPLWATRSASTNPGGGSSQPSNVRTGTLRLTAAEGAAPARSSSHLPPDITQRPINRRRAHRQ